MAQQFARAGQSSSSNGSGELPIMALSNDDQFVYAAVGNTIYRVRKSEMSSLTLVPPRRADPKP